MYFQNLPANKTKYMSRYMLDSQLWAVSAVRKIMHQETECL